MISLATFLIFCGAVLAMLVTPGPNMAFVLSHSAVYGPRGGLAVASGIAVADVIMTLLTATGVTAIIAAWPPAFDVLRYAGAVYLLWLAFKAVRSPVHAMVAGELQASMRKVFLRAVAGSLINPKPLLFFMVFLPQFVDMHRGPVHLQLVTLGLTLTVLAFAFHAVLGVFAGEMGQLIARNPRAANAQRWLLGGVLGALAMRLFFIDRPAST
jgi:threonine/homoserine/homoserine lactone efflux protein